MFPMIICKSCVYDNDDFYICTRCTKYECFYKRDARKVKRIKAEEEKQKKRMLERLIENQQMRERSK